MEQVIVSSKNGIGLRLPDINEIEIYGEVGTAYDFDNY